MSARGEGASARVAEILREEAPALDDLHRARLERRVLEAAEAAAARGAEARAGAASAAGRGAGPAGGTYRRRAAATAVVLGGLAAAAAVALWLAPRAHGPRYAIERVGAGAIAAGTVLEVGAGEVARAEVFDLSLTASAGASLRFEVVSRDDIRLVLSRGGASFEFHPEERGRERVTIETPSASVEIVGTALTVRVEDDTTEVSVSEGRVRVVPVRGEPRFVSAGERVRVERPTAAAAASVRAAPSPGSPRAAVEAAGAAVAAARGDDERAPPAAPAASGDEVRTPGAGGALATASAAEPTVSAAEAPAVSAPSAVDGAPSPRARLERAELLLDDDRAGARRELLALAGAGTPRAVRVEALLLLGDSHRDAHERDRALEAYAEAARVGRGTPGGATAIFERASLLERMGRTSDARAGYEAYLGAHPDGANAVQARNRLSALGE